MRKLFYICCFLLALGGTLSVMTSCSNDDIWVDASLEDVPSNVFLFVSNRCPGATVKRVVYVENGLYAYLSNGVEIEFDADGVWRKAFFTGEGTQVFVSPFLGEDKYASLADRLGEVSVPVIYATHEGESVELEDGRRIAFDYFKPLPLGYEYVGAEAVERLPQAVRDWMSLAFPENEVTRVVEVSDLTEHSTSEWRVWVDERFLAEFNAENRWTSVSGEFEIAGIDEDGNVLYMELPATVLAMLPEKVHERLKLSCPDARVTSMNHDAKDNYTLQIGPHSSWSMYGGDKEFVIETDRIRDFLTGLFGDVPVTSFSISWNHDYDNPQVTAYYQGFEFVLNTNYEWIRMNGHGRLLLDSMLALLPPALVDYCQKAAAGEGIVFVDREDGNYHVVLSDNSRLLFAADGSFIKEEPLQ